MIWAVLFKILKSIFNCAVWLCAFIIKTLGLGLCVIFSIIFIIVCAVFSFKLAGGVMIFFIIGNIILFLAPQAFRIYKFKKKRQSKREPKGRVSNLSAAKTPVQNRVEPASEKLVNRGFEPAETPMIFSTRKDPDILIYEYGNRLEFYRKTKKGLVLLSTEYKD